MMSWTYVFLPVILGAVVSCQDVLSNPVVELTMPVLETLLLHCGQCWMLLVILCPCSALLLSLLSSLVVYLRCRRKDITQQ
ncbi:unnamed protein product [Arctogadus glacialis]